MLHQLYNIVRRNPLPCLLLWPNGTTELQSFIIKLKWCISVFFFFLTVCLASISVHVIDKDEQLKTTYETKMGFKKKNNYLWRRSTAMFSYLCKDCDWAVGELWQLCFNLNGSVWHNYISAGLLLLFSQMEMLLAVGQLAEDVALLNLYIFIV